ncbi:radical SAM protein [Candidatus Omnitrophota bacterium]
MRILLLNPPFFPRFSRSQRSPAVTKSGTLYYPFWLAYATGVLEKAGFEVNFVDAPAQKLSLEYVLKMAKDLHPELIIIDTSTPSIHNDIKVAENLKEVLPECFILLVGTHVSALPEETLVLSKKIDAVARGEYEMTALELADEIRKKDLSLNNIQGLSYRASDTIIHNPNRPPILELDKLPMVSEIYKKYLNIKDYFFAASLYPEVQIFTARGCPFRCFFCLWPQSFQGRKYRTRRPESVLKEFLYIKKNLPEVKAVVIEDDTFTIDKKRVRDICNLLIKHKVNIEWNANVRIDLDIETMKIMKKAGCYLIIVGIETAEQTILDNINKDLKIKDVEDFFNNAKKVGLLVHAAFMAGNPGETRESLNKTLKLAKRFLPDTVQFFPLMTYPGTKAYMWAKEKGYLKINSFKDYLTKDGLHKCVIDLPKLSGKDLQEWCNKSRRSFYLSPRYIFYKIRQMVLRPEHLIRTCKTFTVFIKYILGKS